MALALENGRRRKTRRKSTKRTSKSRMSTRSARTARSSRSRTSRTRRKTVGGKWKFGMGIKRSRSKGAKLISTARKQGRAAYVVKGVKGWFAKFTSAKKAANKKVYAGKARRSGVRRRTRR